MRRPIESAQRKPRLVSLVKTGLGAPALDGPDSNQASIALNGVGDYTITLNEPLGRDDIEVQLTSNTQARKCRASVKDKSTVRVLCFSDFAETTPAEADFDCRIYGVDVPDKI